MKNKSKRIHLALILCVSLIANCISLFGIAPVSRAEQAVEELTLPTGGLEQLKAYEVTDKSEIEKVPYYDNGILLYSNTIFDRGTGDYGYNCLSDNQKTFYDSLEISLKNFNADDNGTFEKVTFSDGSNRYTPFKVNFTNTSIGIEEAVHTWVAFRADHPWLFWLGDYAYSNSSFMPLVEEEYETDIVAKKILDTTVKNGVEEYIDAVTGISNTYEKVRIIHDKIVDKVNYAYKANGTTPEDANWAHSVVGVLDNSHNAVVCEGYAKTFSFILNILDIPNVYIVGDAGGGHAWNAVSFNNGNTYYYVDATWDDQGGKGNTIENTYIYFAMPKDKFETSHTPDNTSGTGFNWQYEMPNLGNDIENTYFKKYSAYATDDMITNEESAKTFLDTAKATAPSETCVMLLGNSAIQSVATALGIGSFSYIHVNVYDMNLYATPSGKTPTATPSTKPSTAPSTEPSESPSTSSSASPSASPTQAPVPSTSPVVPSDNHIFNDYDYTSPVSDASVIYGNGMNKKIDGKRVNNKDLTVYTDIVASYKYALNSRDIVIPSIGKVIVAVTKSIDKPTVDYKKNKVTDTSASKIAKARIKNGQITVTAVGKESGLVYLWVIDTGNKGISACCPIDVKLAPKKLEIQNTSGTKLTKTKLANGNTLEVCVAGLVGSTKTDDCTYTATVDSNYQSYITVTPVQSSTNKFTINAKGLKNNKNTKAAITFKCDQNDKKTKFSLTITQ